MAWSGPVRRFKHVGRPVGDDGIGTNTEYTNAPVSAVFGQHTPLGFRGAWLGVAWPLFRAENMVAKVAKLRMAEFRLVP